MDRGVGVDVQDALGALDGQLFALQRLEGLQRLLGGAGQEGGVPLVGGVVTLDEGTNVDAALPLPPR
ncbi:hypothetical protein FM114_08965 [Luteococcus japonicus LSP_Lj1]|uniref:Uncharacterized protein n=1 Tax=Luteococcus japonicus LSP_Lj1 TaxID=1255658 RepID=A0A1R4JQS2_9ACTN|nr:hypothetical protein FM114_08965 [Luteococcus japonicus LSP_Lj1]